MPVYWKANRNAWMTKDFFADWFNDCFIPCVEDYMKQKNLSFKVLLIVDNATSHCKQLSHPNVQILFLPPNCTSLIQPLDQGIIHAFKAIYLRQSYDIIYDRLENKEDARDVIKTWKDFSILDCINTIQSSCKEIKKSTLNACWKPLLPEMVQNIENAIPSVNEQYNSIINSVSRLTGEGFTDINNEDVRKLFEEESLNEEELMEFIDQPTTSNTTDDNVETVESMNIDLNGIEKAIELSERLELRILESDSSLVRTGKFTRELRRILLPYRELLAEQNKENESINTIDISEHSRPLKKRKIMHIAFR